MVLTNISTLPTMTMQFKETASWRHCLLILPLLSLRCQSSWGSRNVNHVYCCHHITTAFREGNLCRCNLPNNWNGWSGRRERKEKGVGQGRKRRKDLWWNHFPWCFCSNTLWERLSIKYWTTCRISIGLLRKKGRCVCVRERERVRGSGPEVLWLEYCVVLTTTFWHTNTYMHINPNTWLCSCTHKHAHTHKDTHTRTARPPLYLWTQHTQHTLTENTHIYNLVHRVIHVHVCVCSMQAAWGLGGPSLPAVI